MIQLPQRSAIASLLLSTLLVGVGLYAGTEKEFEESLQVVDRTIAKPAALRRSRKRSVFEGVHPSSFAHARVDPRGRSERILNALAFSGLSRMGSVTCPIPP